jgi:GNAT superfamily N-acetyltransferase
MEQVTNYNNYLITTDKSVMNSTEIHQWLSEESYWAKGIPFELFQTAFDHSFCVGAMHNGRQVGFGRLITDYATFAYLADVYVEEQHRGKGISKAMMKTLFDLEWVKQLRRIKLMTLDAHELYKQFGLHAYQFPERAMELNPQAKYTKE